MKSYGEYRNALHIALGEIRSKLNKDYQSFPELISDLEEALRAAKKLDKELSR